MWGYNDVTHSLHFIEHGRGLGMAQLAKWLPPKLKDLSLVSGRHVEKPGMGAHVLTIPALGSRDRKVSSGVG